MAKASDIKKGDAVEHNGKMLVVKSVEVQSACARGGATIYKIRFTDIATGGKVEEKFRSDDVLPNLDLARHFVTFSYIDGEDYIFMNNEDYTQYIFKQHEIEEELLFIDESIQGLVLLAVDGQPVGIELPQSVELVIIETAPSIKGASASARSKPASFATGLVIQVPEYIASGEKVRINTLEKRFMGRADK